MSINIDCVFIFSVLDFDQVQRHTEKYYLSKYCSANFDTHTVSPSSRIPGAVNHHILSDGILGVVTLNVLLLPLWVKLFLTEDPDVVYCYPNVITPSVVAQFMDDTRVVFDIRADPFEQQEEFHTERNQTIPPIKQVLLMINRILFEWTLNRSDLVVTLSDDLAAKIQENYRVDLDSIEIVPSGVDVDEFKPVGSRPGNQLSLVYVGTINELRGLDTIVEAVSILNQETQSKIRVCLIGGGNDAYISELLSSFEKTAPDVMVKYHGYVDHNDVPQVAGENDVAISLMPGLESYEVSSPAKIYEYLALGLPVIATDIPAHRRMLTHGQDAIIVDEEAPQQVADAVRELMNDSDKLHDMSDAARSTSIQNSWDQRFSTLFDRIASL